MGTILKLKRIDIHFVPLLNISIKMAKKTNLAKVLQDMQSRMHDQITNGCSSLLQEMNKNLTSLVNITVSNVEALEESLREDIILIEKQIGLEIDCPGQEDSTVGDSQNESDEDTANKSEDDWIKIQELAEEKLKEIYKEIEEPKENESTEPIYTQEEAKIQVRPTPKQGARNHSNVIEHKQGKEHVKKRGRRRNSSNDGSNEMVHPPSPKIRRKVNGNSSNILYAELPQAQLPVRPASPLTPPTENIKQDKDNTFMSLALGLSENRGRLKSRRPRTRTESNEENWICDSCSFPNSDASDTCSECSTIQPRQNNETKRSVLEAIIRLASIGKNSAL